MLLLAALLACAPKPVAPAAPAALAEVRPPEPPPAPAVAPPAPVIAAALAPPVLTRTELEAAAVPMDARVIVNAWRVRHNAGLARLQAGDAAGAVVDAQAALALAPADHRTEPLLLLAHAASQAGDVDATLLALEGLGPDAEVPWGLYYNGSIDAARAGRPDLAHRYAQAALARKGDVAQVAPLAVRAALRVQELDAALIAGRLLPADHPARADLVRALVAAGRCVDAERLAPGACA